MKVEVEDISKVIKRVNIELPAEQVADEIEEQYQELQSKAQVKGFRPGKVPRKILERLFKDYVLEAVADNLVKNSMETALSRKGLQPLVNPVVDADPLKPGEPFKYTLHVEVKPTVEELEYKGLTFTHRDEELSEEDVELALARLREETAVLQDPDPPRPTRPDDQLVVELTIRDEVTQEILPEEKEEQTISLWDEFWIPGLKEKLTGLSVGQEVSFTAAIPATEEVPEKYRGRTLNLTFMVKGIKERRLPELNDQFAKDYSRHETLDQLRDAIRRQLKERNDELNRDAREEKLIQILLEKNPLELPPSLVRKEAESMAGDFLRHNLRSQPREEERGRFVEMFLKEARSRLHATYLLEAIAQKEGISASDEEVEAQIAKRAQRIGIHPDKLKGRLTEADIAVIKQGVIFKKTLDFLVANANIEKEGGEEDPPQNEDAGGPRSEGRGT